MIKASFACLRNIITTTDAKLFEKIPEFVNSKMTLERSVEGVRDKVEKVFQVSMLENVVQSSVHLAINAYLLQPKMDTHLTQTIIGEMFSLIKFCGETERFSMAL